MKKIICLLLIIIILPSLIINKTDFVLARQNSVNLYFFYGDTCPHCQKAEKFLEVLKEKHPSLQIKSYEVFSHKENAELLLRLLEACGKAKQVRVPAIFIGSEVIIGYLSDETTGSVIEKTVEDCLQQKCPDPIERLEECEVCQCQGEVCQCQACQCEPEEIKKEQIVHFPLIGKIDLSKLSLPALTITLGALDGFNPCAMWVLLFLIALLLNTRSRKKMFFIGGTFIAASGIVYYLLLSAWLNLFLAISYVSLTRIIIGVAALVVGIWQIKNFITYQPGVCRVLGVKSRLERTLKKKAENIVQAPVLVSAFLGVVILAFGVNLIEFFCSAGLPAIYTRILTLNQLSSLSYHLYLLLYTFVFMLDDLIIFTIAILTLSKIGFTEKYNQWSTLIGGLLIIILGILLIFKPDFLMFIS
jgi:glutaredoxin